MHFRWQAIGMAVATLAATAPAEIDYRISVLQDRKLFNVEMTFNPREKATSLQMPSFMPGAYMKVDFWKSVTGVSALDEEGHPLTIKHDKPDTWTIDTSGAKKVTFSYEVPASGGRFGPPEKNPVSFGYSGPAVYMYLVGRKDERSVVSFDAPADWMIAIGLDPSPGPHRQPQFIAKNYDVLADNPVTLGKFRSATYRAAGRDHLLAISGELADDVDLEKALKATKFVSEAETDFFGGAPYSHYVWHFSPMDRADGAGGLEHLSSTQISLAVGVGPRAVRVFAHEFFHLWNVKRIRSKVLGPFDYTQVPKTGALWWLEGVTDYYASHLLHRYGWDTDADYYSQLVRNLDQVRGNPARLEVSPYDASFRVGEVNNSSGYKVNYYPTGWILGMVLDIELRSRTNGKSSLDDVEHALWQMCRNDQPGFEEGEIRNQLVRFGGAEMGPLYDQWVMKPGELPVEAQLAKVGLKIVEKSVTSPSVGFSWSAGRSSGGALVSEVSVKDGGIEAKDVVVGAAGTSFAGMSASKIDSALRAALAGLKTGEKIRLQVKHGDAIKYVEVTLADETKKVKVIEEAEGVTEAQRRLREGWLFGVKGRPKVIQDPS